MGRPPGTVTPRLALPAKNEGVASDLPESKMISDTRRWTSAQVTVLASSNCASR